MLPLFFALMQVDSVQLVPEGEGVVLFLKTTEDIKVVPYLDYDKSGLFREREFTDEHYVSLYKDKTYVSDYRHALFLMVNDVKNNNMMGRINTYQSINIPSGLELPVDLSSREQFIPLSERLKNIKKDNVRIALLGGFGPAYGDNICGLTTLRILNEEFKKHFNGFELDIYHVQSYKFIDLYQCEGINLLQEPLELEKFCEYDYYYDITSINSITGYYKRSIVDNFLFMFSVDSKNIPKELKRNRYILKHIGTCINEILEAKGRKGKNVLFHSDSVQDCRSIPDDVSRNIVNKILETTDMHLFTVSELNFDHPRFHNLKNISNSFDDFAEIVSLMDKIITVDTSTYHLSDAFSISTLVIFTNAGIGRIADYPTVVGYELEVSFKEQIEIIRQRSNSQAEEDEFIRNNLPLVWERLDINRIIDFLLATE